MISIICLLFLTLTSIKGGNIRTIEPVKTTSAVVSSATEPLSGGGAGVIQDRGEFSADERHSYWEEQVVDGAPSINIPSPSPSFVVVPSPSPPPPPLPDAPSPTPTAEAVEQEESNVTEMLQKLTQRVEGAKSDEAKNAALKAEIPGGDEVTDGRPELGTPAADAMTALGRVMAQGPTMGEMLSDLEQKNDEQNTKDT
jgi:hypothetical protein